MHACKSVCILARMPKIEDKVNPESTNYIILTNINTERNIHVPFWNAHIKIVYTIMRYSISVVFVPAQSILEGGFEWILTLIWSDFGNDFWM